MLNNPKKSYLLVVITDVKWEISKLVNIWKEIVGSDNVVKCTARKCISCEIEAGAAKTAAGA